MWTGLKRGTTTVQRHWDGTDEKVADRQRRDEVVGRLAYRALEGERQDDDQVAAHGDEARDGGDDAEHHDPDRRAAGVSG